MGKDPCKRQTQVLAGREGKLIQPRGAELAGLHGQLIPRKDRKDYAQWVLADTHQLGSEPRLPWQTVVSRHSLRQKRNKRSDSSPRLVLSLLGPTALSPVTSSCMGGSSDYSQPQDLPRLGAAGAKEAQRGGP